jgi:hypothetical protein
MLATRSAATAPVASTAIFGRLIFLRLMVFKVSPDTRSRFARCLLPVEPAREPITGFSAKYKIITNS